MRVKLVLALMSLPMLAMATGASPCGDYGMPCCPDATEKFMMCNEGECQGGICIHCGDLGEPACLHRDKSCLDYDCEVVNGYCRQVIDDCGHVGYAPCEWDGELVCSYGVLGDGICLACGDYEQPCCQYTDSPCYYGECNNTEYPYVGGKCRRNLTLAEETNATTSSSINASIILLFDASSSMADDGKIDNAKVAAKNSIATLSPKDEVALIVFYDCSRIIVEHPFTTDWSALAVMIDTIRPTGGTPIYAAIDFAKAYMDENARGEVRRVIMLTDGIDTCGGGPE